ncbi:MAG: acyltransferase domain-containing protein, partial [Clostridiales bacterium]|nr:acyltransferase domain-containing protein [Clostridiales bacterium]
MRKSATLDKDIAIVGISVACPAGDSVGAFWNGISQGGDFITEVPEDVIDPEYFDGVGKEPDRLYCKRGGFARAIRLDPLRYGVLPVVTDGMDPDQLTALAGVDMALHDADVFKKGIPLQNASIIIGKGNFAGLISLRSVEVMRTANELTTLLRETMPGLSESELAQFKKAYQLRQGRWQADMVIGTMPNLVASLVANRFDMHGPAYCIDAACASGVVAINHSIELLRSGQCDIALAGGMHSSQSAMFWGAFNLMGAISRKEEISPFSETADGLLVGQGGGFVVLKTLRKAMDDGDRIYAIIKDTAVCSDGGGSHVTVTSVQGEIRVMEMAWKRAGMDPEILGHIEAHGTATPVGDRTEITALREFFGDNTHRQAFVGSVKSNIGHTMPAAGMIGVIKTALSLYHRVIPPTLHCEKPLAAMFESRFLPPQEAIEWDGERYPLVAGVNAFGFGGINSHAVLTAYEPPLGTFSPGAYTAFARRSRVYPADALMVSAPDRDTLIRKLQTETFSNTGGVYRLAIFSPDEKRIEQAISIVEKDKPWRGKLDIWFSNETLLDSGGKVVFLFPGVNPERMLAETDTLSEALDLPRLEQELEEWKEKMPEGKWDPVDASLTFIQRIAFDALEKLGVTADMYAGHSIGEWRAAFYAGLGTCDESQYLKLLCETRDLTEYPYIAVNGVSRAVADAWVSQIPGLYLANDNCPNQILLCGGPEASAALIEQLKKEQVFYSVMPFGNLHTPLGADNIELSKKFLEITKVGEGRVPVWSATTLSRVPTNLTEYAELVTDQLTRPVYFRELI